MKMMKYNCCMNIVDFFFRRYITKYLSVSQGNTVVSFVPPRISKFFWTLSRETLRLSRKQNKLFPSGADIKCILSKTLCKF